MVGPAISGRLPYYEALKITPYQGLAAVTLVGISVFHNYARKRPLSASMLKHLVSAVAGLYVGTEIDKFYEDRRNSKVVVLEDYIQRHPEDFPIVRQGTEQRDGVVNHDSADVGAAPSSAAAVGHVLTHHSTQEIQRCFAAMDTC